MNDRVNRFRGPEGGSTGGDQPCRSELCGDPAESVARAERYARGELRGQELDQYVRHLRGCELCRERLAERRYLDSTLARFLEPVAPRAEVWERIEQRLAPSAAPATGPQVQPWKSWGDDVDTGEGAGGSGPSEVGDFVNLPAEAARWEATATAGVQTRRLGFDRVNRRVSMLIRMEPGASYPAHRHGGPEECFVVAGDLRVGEFHMRAGDFQRAEAGSVHPAQSTVGGCLLFISSSLEDELLEGCAAGDA